MPVDALLLGTVTMATREADHLRLGQGGPARRRGPRRLGRVAGRSPAARTSGRSGLDADIHFLDNAPSRAARLLDEVAGDAEAVATRREEIIEALSHTAKPYFGDVAEMTYAQLLERFVALTALGRHGRYEDGAWLDPTHRSRFVALLQQAEARLHPADTGQVPTLFADAGRVDDPPRPSAALVQAPPERGDRPAAPRRRAALPDCGPHAPASPCRSCPCVDADVRRWYQSDSLWQSHSEACTTPTRC